MKRTLSDYPNLQQQRQQLSRNSPTCKNCGAARSPNSFSWLNARTVRASSAPLSALDPQARPKDGLLRLTDPALVPLYRQQIQALRQFETVVDGLVRVGEQLSDLAVAEVVQEKTPGGTGTSRRGASSRRRPGRPPRRGRSPGDFAASLQQHAPGGDPLPLWPAHAQSRAARQRVVNDLGPGALRALPLSMRPLFPGRFPDDERLDIVQTTYSPGVRRLMARAVVSPSLPRPPKICAAMRGSRWKRGKSSGWPKRWATKSRGGSRRTGTEFAVARHLDTCRCLRGQVLYQLRRHRCPRTQRRVGRTAR